jgi:DNA-binding MarR family transcriptional regulator
MTNEADLLAPGRLAGALLDTADWFDTALRARLAARGWPHLSRTRSLVFLHVGRGIVRPAALAREIDVSRQAVQKLLDGLEAAALIERSADPADARSQVVRLTAHGQVFVDEASAILRDLEVELADRLGPDAVTSLRRALAAELGPPPTTAPID